MPLYSIRTLVTIVAGALALAGCDEAAMASIAAPATATAGATDAPTPVPAASGEAAAAAQQLAAYFAPPVAQRNAHGAFIRSAVADGGTMRLEWMVPLSPRNTDQEWERSLERMLREDFNRDFCANGDGQAYYAAGAKVLLTVLGHAAATAGPVLISRC